MLCTDLLDRRDHFPVDDDAPRPPEAPWPWPLTSPMARRWERDLDSAHANGEFSARDLAASR